MQLLRLKQDLRRRGFAVVMFSAEDYLNMHEPLNVVDVLFFLVGATSDQAVEDNLINKGHSATSRGWSRLGQWLSDLPGRVNMTGAEVKATVAPISATLKADCAGTPRSLLSSANFSGVGCLNWSSRPTRLLLTWWPKCATAGPTANGRAWSSLSTR